jgi:hypothetical protein
MCTRLYAHGENSVVRTPDAACPRPPMDTRLHAHNEDIMTSQESRAKRPLRWLVIISPVTRSSELDCCASIQMCVCASSCVRMIILSQGRMASAHISPHASIALLQHASGVVTSFTICCQHVFAHRNVCARICMHLLVQTRDHSSAHGCTTTSGRNGSHHAASARLTMPASVASSVSSMPST